MFFTKITEFDKTKYYSITPFLQNHKYLQFNHKL